MHSNHDMTQPKLRSPMVSSADTTRSGDPGGPTTDDATIRATDNVAAQSRLSAVTCGYLPHDPYAVAFVPGASAHAGGTHAHRRPPLINRGTYLRIAAFDWAVERFLAATLPAAGAQVVSLGAGTDTRYFRFRDTHADRMAGVAYFEVDLLDTVMKKVSVFRKSARLFGGHLAGGKWDAKSSTYTVPRAAAGPAYALLAGDLRHWTDECVPRLVAAGFDPLLPTLVIAECALVYVSPPEAVADIFAWLAHHVTDVGLVTYDQVRPGDDFGRVMVANLRDAGIELPGLHAVPTPEAHVARLRAAGLTAAWAWDLNWVWRVCVSSEEKKRVAMVEMLDEVEELELMWAHYCLAVGVKGPVASEVARVYAKEDETASQ